MKRVTKKVMAWGETVNVAMDALRADKLKAALTMLGVIIGSACIVLVVTVALTGKRYIIQQIEGVGANLTYAQLMRSGKVNALADEISLGDLRAVQTEIPQVVEAAATREPVARRSQTAEPQPPEIRGFATMYAGKSDAPRSRRRPM